MQTTDGQSSTWVIAADGEARESGLGSAHGTARLVGDILTITSFPSDPSYNGVYRWQLGGDCSGTGTLTFTNAPRAGQSLPSTVKGPPASPTRWSVRAYANNVRVVAPLIGAYQLGKFTLSGSGAIAANGAVTGTLSDVDRNTQPVRTLFVKMRVVSGTLSTSGPATTLTLTVEVTSSDRAKGECPTGQTGTVVLTENPTLLPNGQNSGLLHREMEQPTLLRARPRNRQSTRRRTHEPAVRRLPGWRPVGDRPDQLTPSNCGGFATGTRNGRMLSTARW